MSKPFFIWTNQRTGGTSLTALLREISEYDGPKPKIGSWVSSDEPFNRDRTLGCYIQQYKNNIETEIIQKNITEKLESTPLIKHCYEFFDIKFNKLIIDSVKKYSYGHLFLRRKDETSRILSLYLAKQTAVWGVKAKYKYNDIVNGNIQLKPFDVESMIKDMNLCYQLTNQIKSYLNDEGIIYKEVFFEDFYVGSRKNRLDNLYQVFDYFEFDESVRKSYDNMIEEKLFLSSQDSKSIMKFIPNYEEAKVTLDLKWEALKNEKNSDDKSR